MRQIVVAAVAVVFIAAADSVAAQPMRTDPGATTPVEVRYIDPVFHDVEVAYDVPYRQTIDYLGNAVQLRLDIYQPAGDTAAQRPAIVWMHGGYFIFGDKRDMANYAKKFARRGYVSISLQYRLRPGISTGDLAGIAAAGYDAYEDATAGISWLEEHANEYRIDPLNIAAGGYSAGAVTALNLAYLPGNGRQRGSVIDAAVSIAGLSFGKPNAGEPPSIVFHGTADTTVPYSKGVEVCWQALAVGSYCKLVTYQDAGHGIAYQFQHEIVRRTAKFMLARMINRPPDAPAVT